MTSSRKREDTQALYQLPLALDEPTLPLYTSHQDGQELQRRSGTLQLRERLHRYGVKTLSDGELLFLVLCTSAGKETLYERIEGLLQEYSLTWLMQADFLTLSKEHRLGAAKAAQLLAILELARRLTKPETTERYLIKSPSDAARLVMADMAYLDYEEVRILVLNTKNAVLANIRLYQGTLNSSVLRTAELFRPAISRNASGIIMIHNHPSGDPAPSPEDEEVTNQLVAAAKLLDMELVDHLIIGNNRFVSLKERLRW